MYHPGTQTLIETWRALPRDRHIPRRADFDPAALGARMPQAFLLDRGTTGARWRVAGGWIEGAFGRALGGEVFETIWMRESRDIIAASLNHSAQEARPHVIVAAAPGLAGVLEWVVAPLRGKDGDLDRMLGLIQWTAPIDKHARDLPPLRAILATGVGQQTRPRLVLATDQGRRLA